MTPPGLHIGFQIFRALLRKVSSPPDENAAVLKKPIDIIAEDIIAQMAGDKYFQICSC